MRLRIIESHKNLVKLTEQALSDMAHKHDSNPNSWAELVAQRKETITETSSELPLSDPYDQKNSLEEQMTENTHSYRKKQNTENPETADSGFEQNYQSWATLPIGLNLIRNHVINPLLVATE